MENYFGSSSPFLLMGIVYEIITAIFCFTLYTILQRITPEKRQFPNWFVWIFLIPYVGFIFQWIMLPFGIPNAFKNTFPVNQDAIAAADTLFKLGLAQVILTMFGIFFPIHPVNQVAGIAGIVLWILYWVKIIQFKKTFYSASF